MTDENKDSKHAALRAYRDLLAVFMRSAVPPHDQDAISILPLCEFPEDETECIYLSFEDTDRVIKVTVSGMSRDEMVARLDRIAADTVADVLQNQN